MIEPDLLRELETLNGYYYQLWDYEKSHSVLTLRAGHLDQPGHNIHLTFEFVYYIQMPISWREADLVLASEAEFAEIAKITKMRWSLDTVREYLSLFTAEPSNGKVYILGKLSLIKHDVEPIYNPSLTSSPKIEQAKSRNNQ